MFEIKEVARLYTAESGYRLVVGEFTHPLDAERTAAKHYYCYDGVNKSLYRGDDMRELRSHIEFQDSADLLEPVDEIVLNVLNVRRQFDVSEQQVYEINIDLNTWHQI